MSDYRVIFQNVVTPLIYILIGVAIYNIYILIIKKYLSKNNNRKKKTIINIVNNIIKYLIAVIVIILILNIYKVDTTSLIASLGIAGLVVGLALKNLFQDFIAGAFIIFEDQYSVGDTITINNFRGEVLSLGLKTTKIKDYRGNVLSINNGVITEVINHTICDQLATITVDIAYEENIEKVIEVLEKYTENLTLEDTTGKIEILGVNNLGESGVTIKIIVPTKANEQFKVERQLRKLIKMELDRNNISIAYPHMVIVNEK